MSATTSSAAARSTKPSSASVLLGHNPTTYDSSNPITIFLVQLIIVVVFCRLLHWPLARIRQPRVIAEVIGGILLGPTAFGRIPGFTSHIFPTASMPAFNLVANVGLILFLFIVGLEVDLRLVRKNARVALSVGLASLVLPFGFGCLIAWAVFQQYGVEGQSFGLFLLFIGTALSITAFPVLARILTELKLLRRDVGVTVLAAGVGNDVIGWILLALVIALVNASTGLVALYTILLVVAWVAVLFYAIRPAYLWLARRSGMDNGPSDGMMAVTTLLVVVSAFYTEIIGVHPIFGSFLVGIIMPHEHGWAVALTEKMEDLISVLFLPLYFASSGLKTNIGLLNDGKAWGYTIAIIVAAMFSKIVGSAAAARLNGLLWRESAAVGILMSCKGLVELIVLNVGFQYGILTQRVFTMFVIMALVTTFITTPLTIWAYPTWYQDKVARWRNGEIDWDGNVLESASPGVGDSGTSVSSADDRDRTPIKRFTVVVSRMEAVAPLLRFTHFLSSARIHILRLLELNDRLSQIIKVSESDDLLLQDSLVAIFRTAFQLSGVRSSTALHVLQPFEYADAVVTEVEERGSELLVVPHAAQSEADDELVTGLLGGRRANVCIVVPGSPSAATSQHAKSHSLVRRISGSLSMSEVRGSQTRLAPRPKPTYETSGSLPEAPYLFVPLFAVGGEDELLTLRTVRTLLANPQVKAKICIFQDAASPQVPASEDGKEHDDDHLERLKDAVPRDAAFASRVEFETIRAANPVAEAVRALRDLRLQLAAVRPQRHASTGTGKTATDEVQVRSTPVVVLSRASTAALRGHAGRCAQDLGDAGSRPVTAPALPRVNSPAASPSPRSPGLREKQVAFDQVTAQRTQSEADITPYPAAHAQDAPGEDNDNGIGRLAKLFIKDARAEALDGSAASVWIIQAKN